jgi:hypothetical protein
MRTALLILAGMFIMWLLLRVMSSSKVNPSASWNNIKAMLKTQQFNNVIKTNEFRELVKTSEFRNVIGSLAEDQVVTISKTLIG